MAIDADKTDESELVLYLARELVGGSRPQILVEELRRDYGYSPDRAHALLERARAALLTSREMRSDEQVVRVYEQGVRNARRRVRDGMVLLGLVVLIGAAVFLATGRPTILTWVVVAGVVMIVGGLGASRRYRREVEERRRR